MSEEWSLKSEYLLYLAGLAEVKVERYRDFMYTRKMILITIGESPQAEEYYFVWRIDDFTVIIDHLYKYEYEMIEEELKFANVTSRVLRIRSRRRSDHPHKCKLRNVLTAAHDVAYIAAPIWGIEREGDRVSYFVMEKPSDEELIFMNPFTYDGLADPQYISREQFIDTLREKRTPMLKARQAKKRKRTTATKKEVTDPT